MVELVKTTNAVRLTYLQALLDDTDIPFFVFDQHISMLEAGIGAFPRRVMVEEAYFSVAKTILSEAHEYYND
jgi:hypothetical protein